MIQAARHSAAFWPIRAQTTTRHTKNKDPSEASLGSCTHVLPHRRFGGAGGPWKRPAFVDLEPDRFRILYQIAHKDAWPGFGADYPQAGNVSCFGQFHRGTNSIEVHHRHDLRQASVAERPVELPP